LPESHDTKIWSIKGKGQTLLWKNCQELRVFQEGAATPHQIIEKAEGTIEIPEGITVAVIAGRLEARVQIS
jgi:hypothetical protein